jgi:hypothetical protein
MSQSRRQGTQILQDEIDSAIALVRTHGINVTRKLEKVKDMVSRYCENKGRSSAAPAASASAVAAAAPPVAPAAPVPTPTVLPYGLNTIQEENEESNTNANTLAAPALPAEAQAGPSVPVSLKSKGPESWSDFRKKVGEGTPLKTGKQGTLDKISTLWTQAKGGKNVTEIAQYLKNELQIEPSLANRKAPALAKIASNYVKRGTRSARPPSNKGTRTVRKTAVAPAAEESSNNFVARMNAAGARNAEEKERKFLESQRLKEEYKRQNALAATPVQTRRVPMAAAANRNANLSAPIAALDPYAPTSQKSEDLSL